ncbi:hypothetical protein AMJ85_10245, partial [candidate division BRC1 bacterium SM23_51]
MRESNTSDRSFVHLHVQSHFSLSDGVASIETLVRQAANLDMAALALTDHNSLAGMVTFLESCQANGIQPIVGCEIDVFSRAESPRGGGSGSLVLLVESEIGYSNLAQLVRCAQAKACSGQPPHVTHEELAERCTGLIALVGASSPMRQFLHPPDAAKVEDYLTDLVRAFGKENLFFEIVPAASDDLRSLNEYFIQLGEFLGIGVAATNDVHYVWPEDELARLFLIDRTPPRAIGEKALELGEQRRHLASSREMRDRFAFVPQAIANTRLIAERCRFRPELRRRRLLVHDFARGFDAESHLWDLVFRCATEKYGDLDEAVKSRLNEEFDYLSRHDLANYFLLLWNLAGFLGEKKIPCLVRRGGITTSLVAYVLGLTGLDPLEHHLGFEPLVEEGALFPDVTVEVPARHLPRLVEYLAENYGRERIARLGRHQYWPKQTLVETICRWVGLPRQKAEALIAAEAISTRRMAGGGSLRWADLFRGGARSLPSHHPSALSFVFDRLHPLPRALIAQGNRLVLSGEAIDRVVALAYPSGENAVTQLDAADCDALGLPPLSLVTSRSLDILDDAIGWVRREKDQTFDISEIESEDSETFRLFGRGRTVGVPGFEGVAQRSSLRRERPANLERLIRFKTTSPSGRNPATYTPPGTVVADCQLAYRCAYTKAHYPVSYYTALLTHVCRNRWRLARVLREMAQEGIRLLPPDINLSSYGFAQVGERIRMGLVVISQMGEKAAAEINSVRRGGAFHSLLDFCRRTDPKLIHHRLVENLIKAAAMDSFGLRRSQMLAMLDRAIGMPRSQPARPGASLQMEFEFPSLAAGDSEEDLKPPDLPELPLHLRLQYELQTAGHTFSADLLSPFDDLLGHCRIARAPVALSPRMEGRDFYLAGMVDQIERANPQEPEGPAGWLDFNGVLVAVPKRLFKPQGQTLRGREPLMIGGKLVCHNDECYLQAHAIVPLIKVHQQASQARRVVLDLEKENKHTVRALRQICGQF